MICFEVSLNGEKLRIAGIGETGVLNAILSFVGKETPRGESEGQTVRLRLNVGGLRTDEDGVASHLDWVSRYVSVGDEIRLKIIESEESDEPATVRTESPEDRRKRELDYLKRVKAALEREYTAE
jgi:hypothetical protein